MNSSNVLFCLVDRETNKIAVDYLIFLVYIWWDKTKLIGQSQLINELAY